MTTSYTFDQESASNADNAANRVDSSGAYIGIFTSVHAFKSSKGTDGLHFEFQSSDGGSTQFDLYTRKEDGTAVFGMNQVQAMMAIMGLKGLTAVTGRHQAWVDGNKQEVEGEVFPDLCGKRIGLVLQKELYTKGSGQDGYRFSLYGVFHADTRFTASEMKDKASKPEKLAKILSGLKDKDTRKARDPEPSQPSMSAPSGDY